MDLQEDRQMAIPLKSQLTRGSLIKPEPPKGKIERCLQLVRSLYLETMVGRTTP